MLINNNNHNIVILLINALDTQDRISEKIIGYYNFIRNYEAICTNAFFYWMEKYS